MIKRAVIELYQDSRERWIVQVEVVGKARAPIYAYYEDTAIAEAECAQNNLSHHGISATIRYRANHEQEEHAHAERPEHVRREHRLAKVANQQD